MQGNAARSDLPVYVCLQDNRFARELVNDLREHGLRSRPFASAPVLWNAASAHRPAAIIADPAAAPLPAALVADDGNTDRPDLIAVAIGDTLDERLAIAEAGFDACFPLPINRTALLHRLHHGHRGASDTMRVAVVAAEGTELTASTADLESGFAVRRFPPHQSLLADLADFAPQAILVDGDADTPGPAGVSMAIRQFQPLTTIPLMIATGGDKRVYDRLGSRCGLDAILGLPIAARDLAGILRARVGRVGRLATAHGYLARRDPVTGLFNRRYFTEVVAQALAARGGAARVAAFHLTVSPAAECDTPGTRDTARVMVADRLRRQLPPLAVAARLDTDEYAILVSGVDEESLQQLYTQLHKALTKVSWTAGDHTFAAHTTLGMAMADGGETSVAALIAKARRKPEKSGADARAANVTGLTDHWRDAVACAVEENRFRLVYQPISSLSGHPGSLFEVFVRMIDPGGGEVLPGEFIPSARRAGLGPILDRWVLAQAVHVLSGQQGATAPTLFVKVMPETLHEQGFPAWLAARLAEDGVQPEQIVLEIPHAAVLARRADTLRLMQTLAEVGCGVAVEYFDDTADDGSTLQRGGFQYLKLDHALTREVLSSPAHGDRVRHITQTARRQRIHTIACLVQDAMALSSLWQAGVDYIQGNFMQTPTDVFAAD